MTWHLNGQPAPRDPSSGWVVNEAGVKFPPGWDLAAEGFVWVEPTPPGPERLRVTKARFGDLFTDDQHAAMNLLRWQARQMDAAERAIPNNPLVYVETLFIKFDLPAEFIELDLPMVADGLGLLGMLGVFGDDAAAEIARILRDEDPA